MRGRQINLYLHPDDEPLVERFVRHEFDSVVLPLKADEPLPQPVATLREVGFMGYIVPNDLLDDIHLKYIETQGYWLLEESENAAVEWSRSSLIDGVLYRGRFYYIPAVGSDSDDFSKDQRFLNKAEHLFRWIRKFAPNVETKSGKLRLGPSAADQFRAGRIALGLNMPGSPTGVVRFT